MGTLNQYNPSLAKQGTLIGPTITYGVHTLKFSHATGGTYTYIDAIEIP